jgi:uncharacterized protein (DUF2147 family)
MVPKQATGSAILAAALIGCFQSASASSVEGNWQTSDFVLNVFSCQQSMCGKIAWMKDPHRRQRDCGQTIVRGLSQTGPDKWSGGSIYDPADGMTYDYQRRWSRTVR